MGACVAERGSQVFLCEGGGLRHRYPGGRPGADLRAFLSGGQIPFPGDRRHRPGACHHEKCYPHAPGRHQGVQ